MDVREFNGFMLDVEKLTASELVALSSGEEFKAAVMLWCRAWKQVPAGSLPNDDRVLAAFSGAGKQWKKVKEMALRGFVLCSDGRLYHQTLCEDARRAYGKKVEATGARDRKIREREERAAMFAQLKAVGVTPDWNITTFALRTLVTAELTSSGTRDDTPPVTAENAPPDTAPDTNLSPPNVTAIQGQDRTGQRSKKKLTLGGQGSLLDSGRFHEFWKIYPRKVGGKDAAADAFRKALSRASADTIIAGAKAYAEKRKDEDPQYTAHPKTWLHAGRWSDEDVAVQGDPVAEGWRNSVSCFKRFGVWPMDMGPKPTESANRVPPEILAEFGFTPGAA